MLVVECQVHHTEVVATVYVAHHWDPLDENMRNCVSMPLQNSMNRASR